MTPSPPAPGTQAKYQLPTIAFILSLVGFCCCPTALVGSVLGIVAWIRISKEPHLPGKGLAIAATFIPFALIPIVGIQAAIAIPNFIKFQARSKQSECKTNLKSIYVAQMSHEADKGAWAADFEELGVQLERGNRYAYYLSKVAVHPADTQRHPQAAGEDHVGALLMAGVEPSVEATGFLAACVGNIDNDQTLDVWTVSNVERQGPQGPIPAGSPSNDLNDVVD
jgi:type IV pilus assembly protein PilA